jgi:hypothetical protein
VIGPKAPLVSIGVPVYNAQRYLRAALDSLLAQDYQHLELIISDNASTDQTAAICEDYASRDRRIQFHRADRNMGAVWNFNRTFELSSGAYFMWAAFDDLRSPSYVRRCVAALEQQPSAVLCCTDVQWIDPAGQEIGPLPSRRTLHPVGVRRSDRVRAIASANFWYDHYGLIRSNALRATRLGQPIWGFDVVLLLELCLRGAVILVPEQLFALRVFPEKVQSEMAAGLAGSSNESSVVVSWSDLALEMARAIRLAPIGRAERALLTARFLTRFCLLNHTIRGYIRQDVGRSMRRAFRAHRYGRATALLAMAAAIYPVQHRLGKAVYGRVVRRPSAVVDPLAGLPRKPTELGH